MPVDTVSKEYAAMAPKWERCRDAYEGGDAIKAKGARYLPPLDSHVRNGSFVPEGARKYAAYLERALWYNATARTVDGLAGGIFQKAPKITAPEPTKSHLSDVTLTNLSAEMFAHEAAREVLKLGRAGILVDMADIEPATRPYWSSYCAEDIFSYRAITIDGDEILTRVVLREVVQSEDPKDPFVIEDHEIYRVLELVGFETGNPEYQQTKWVKDQKGDWIAGKTKKPMRRGKPLPLIPFVFLGPDSISPKFAKPPLLDLVDVNISHYRTMADLEHGRHRVAVPTPWVSGFDSKSGPLLLGEALLLEKDGNAGMLEFTGQGLGALERADQQKRHMMAVLGARLLEEQNARSNVSETAAAVGMRHAGEQATLKTLAQALESGLTLALQWHAWWVGMEQTPAETGALFELNKDFSVLRMPPEELRAIVEAAQANRISMATLWHLLQEGGLARPGVTWEEELEAIEASSEQDAEDAEAEAEAEPEEEEPMLVGNPYTILRRKGKFVVVKADTGQQVPGGVHPTMRRAKKHHAALEAAHRGEG